MKGATTRLLLVIPCFAFLLALINSLIIRQQPAATLTIEMQSSVTSHAKVFYDTGEGINESESDERLVPGGPNAHFLRFPFPLKTVRAIRFDPLDSVGAVEIRSAVVERPGSHQVVRKLDLSRISPRSQIASFSEQEGTARIVTVEAADDPQLDLVLEGPITAHYPPAELFSWPLLRIDAFCILLAAGVFVAARNRWRWWPVRGKTAGCIP